MERCSRKLNVRFLRWSVEVRLSRLGREEEALLGKGVCFVLARGSCVDMVDFNLR